MKRQMRGKKRTKCKIQGAVTRTIGRDADTTRTAENEKDVAYCAQNEEFRTAGRITAGVRNERMMVRVNIL